MEYLSCFIHKKCMLAISSSIKSLTNISYCKFTFSLRAVMTHIIGTLQFHMACL